MDKVVEFIGIDVGLTGAIAWHRTSRSGQEKERLLVRDMPIYKERKKTRLDEKGFVSVLRKIVDDKLFSNRIFAVVEKQQPFPQQGIVSTGSIMYQYGFISGILTALEIPFQTPRPRQWQSEFGVIRGKVREKHSSYEAAQRLFPEADLKTPRGKILDGRCDAILLVEYGRRKWWGDVVKIGEK